MSKKQYLRALNEEIQRLNDVIDFKILHDRDYRRESRRHKRLLREIKKQELRSSFIALKHSLIPSWF